MATHFNGEGNIGSKPEFIEIPNGDNEPRRLLRLNVYFDNAVRKASGDFDDKGGFWANVDWWHRDAEHYSGLFAKGQRVVILGRMVLEEWENDQSQPQSAMKIRADRVALLPHRIASVAMQQRSERQPAEQ